MPESVPHNRDLSRQDASALVQALENDSELVFPSDTLDRESYAGRMLFNGEAEQNFPRKTPAETWFSFKGCDRSEVEEQSFLLPNDEILTILKLPDEAVA
ncbi:hypothetical protein [Bradyrhizobium japonicum]|uniref:hypothetical protein n=1 Tax=Bradyrhizobium japonicum TaxID=375 RepID=UPI0004625645|nr:hypothetical protein [Bradyrhizobium japonicum]